MEATYDNMLMVSMLSMVVSYGFIRVDRPTTGIAWGIIGITWATIYAYLTAKGAL